MQQVSHPARDRVAQPTMTWCMGYWQVPENTKRPMEHYFALIPTTLSMLAGERLVFFCDNAAIRQWMETCCEKRHIELNCVDKPLTQLPAFDFAGQIVGQTELYGRNTSVPAQFNDEKGLWHYWRDFRCSGPAAYQRILAIWLSKVLLVHETIERDPFGSREFAWIDATASRFNGQRRNWNFREVASHPGAISHYSSTMRKLGRLLSLNASFLQGSKDSWSKLVSGYLHELSVSTSERYPNDEETILHNVREAHPELFRTIDLPSQLSAENSRSTA